MSVRLRFRWFFRSLAGIALAMVLLVAASLLVLSQSSTRDWVRDQLREVLAATLEEPVEITSVSALWLDEIAIRGLSIGNLDHPLAQAAGLRVRWFLADLLPPRIGVSVGLEEPVIDLERFEDGRWNFDQLLGEEDADPSDSTVEIPWWLARVDLDVADGGVGVTGLVRKPLMLEAVSIEAQLRNGPSKPAAAEIVSLTANLGEQTRVEMNGNYELSRARLRAALSIDPLAGHDLASLVPGMRPEARFAVSARVEGTLESPEFEIALTDDPARIDARGSLRLDGESRQLDVDLGVQRVDLAAFVVDAPEGEINGRSEVALRFEAAMLEEVHGQLSLEESRIDDFRVETLEANVGTQAGVVDFAIDSRTPGGELSGQMHGTVALRAPHGLRASGTIDLRDAATLPEQIAGFLDGSRLSAKFAADVADPLAPSPSGSLALEVGAGTMRGVPVRGAELRARMDTQRATVERLWLGADRTDIEAKGWVQLSASPDRRAVQGQLSGPLSLALFSDAFGVVDTKLEVRGFLDDLGGTANLISAGPIEVGGVRGDFSAQLDASHLGGPDGEATLSVAGSLRASAPVSRILGTSARALRVRAAWSGPAWAEPRQAVPHRLDVRAEIGDETPGSVVFAARGTGRQHGVEVDVEEFAIHPEAGPLLALAAPARITLGDDGIAFDGVRVDIAEGRISAQGRFGPDATSRDDLDVRAVDVDLAVICQLLGVTDRCEGTMAASLEVQGVGSRPEIVFDLRTDHLNMARQDYGALVATAHRRGEELRIEVALEGGEAGLLRLDGGLPLEPGALAISRTRPAHFDLVIEDLEIDALRALAGRSLRRLDGRATGQARLRGTLTAPKLSGELGVRDIVLGADATGVVYRNGALRASLDSARFSLDEFALQEGAIAAGGHVDLRGGLPSQVDLWLALDEALLARRSEADVTASGKAQLQGPLSALRLEGDVRIDEATLRPNVVPGGGGPAPDPTIEVARRSGTVAPWVSGVPVALGGEKPPRAAEPAPRASAAGGSVLDPYAGLSMRLGLELGDRTVVRRHDANLRLSGGLEVQKSPGGDPSVLGNIDGRRGWYIFQGRRFEIDSASVTFSGRTPIDPSLDVRARYRSGDYRVQIRITGLARRPNLDLSSDPPLDESDILAVILFGSPASQLSDSQGQALQSQALALVASYVAPKLQRSVLDSFGLASLTFSMPSGDTAGTVGVGRYFGDDIFVSVAHDFGGPTGGTQRQLEGLIGSSVTIQYSLSPQITIQGASSTEGESSVDLMWHRRY